MKPCLDHARRRTPLSARQCRTARRAALELRQQLLVVAKMSYGTSSTLKSALNFSMLSRVDVVGPVVHEQLALGLRDRHGGRAAEAARSPPRRRRPLDAAAVAAGSSGCSAACRARRDAAEAGQAGARQEPARSPWLRHPPQHLFEVSIPFRHRASSSSPGLAGRRSPHPTRTRFAPSCQRTVTGSPGPTPLARAVPGWFWRRATSSPAPRSGRGIRSARRDRCPGGPGRRRGSSRRFGVAGRRRGLHLAGAPAGRRPSPGRRRSGARRGR